MKKFDLIIVALFISLFKACDFGFERLFEETRLALEASSKEIDDQIAKIREEAAQKGVDFKAFAEAQTESRVTLKEEVISKARVKAIDATGSLLNRVEKEALKLKASGNQRQFSDMYKIMIKSVESLEVVGIKGVKESIYEDVKRNPINSADRLVRVKVKIENKLQFIKQKQRTIIRTRGKESK
ncbi:DbpA/DbpB family decorin-binding adhesin [Borreliella lusitaniae]|uniref:DbpA/DbpB family decorin-binding adhesin n=1 Tax=Borreliella lusitaniae TaxID=100177 RepID=UPI002930AF02|nr:DbpA/DbpB family decorin-binding adhesin [Borreliella lusitaniae]WNY67296.1 DbpA/DbpB family decorin-binding adhesin [Borreliella lusitaniae]